jgi:hypothetical protein
MTLLRNMALGVMPDVLRASDGPPLEAHDFLIRGTEPVLVVMVMCWIVARVCS